jgi:hypothetical protein
MSRSIVVSALTGLLFAAFVLNVANADAGVVWPTPYGGHTDSPGHCESPTHLSYYDPRNLGQTAYAANSGNGDSVYYVDTNPLAGFDGNPDLSYTSTQTSDQDCRGTPVLRATAYGAVTIPRNGPSDDVHLGFPTCPTYPNTRSDDRNPDCANTRTGVQGAFYVGTPDGSIGLGEQGGVIVP